MAYQNRDYSPMGMQKVPPGTAPKPYVQGPQMYRAVGGTVYHSVNVERYPEEPGGFPPPPPLETAHKYGYGQEEDFPPPPPPAPPQAYVDDDSHTYSNVYSGEARFMRTEDYRPPDYNSVVPGPVKNKTAPKVSTYSNYPQESNYANIQINIAPPTPTNKDFGYADNKFEQIGQRNSSSAESYRVGGGQVSKSYERERAVPGPMVPTGYQMASPGPGPATTKQSKLEKEAEVDALTDLLMKNMTSVTEDKDYWGMCGRCGNSVSGSVNACSALDNVFHIGCFTCVGCNAALQGKSFFAMETKPYCEACYINSLERCSVCSKPITDRLLRATGKPYHPDCFTCVVCGKSLDGIPFTVDATNQIHCIEDFHKKFAPRCCVCQRPIMPQAGQDETVRIVAMDKSFHVDCYRCEDCNCQLSSEAEGRGCYPLDDHILCKNCNAKRIQALTTKMSTEL
ncbi:lipoma-preferred partner homolog isoform X1 [Biomphalaria glabrata]|uniref:Lipoma-preferred partner homolog isoform X1 n=3 Tax=Biomphalaria glabrata TaxID=6526 RepID=A0A9U8DWM4_BIOGL|nr:lipoma-preferred partner homolog isoform X1 [Biomphalaria glabrata]XP_055863440.1 lipoma-preferred partner homolog isoform X1 [Biomphalaria glabrata]